MDVLNLSSGIDNGFIERVREESGENVSTCYQCGNCTAGCPYSSFFDYPVNQIMRLVQNGQKEAVLGSKAIWLCGTCETCTTRCPCEIDVAHVMDTLRNMAFREKRQTEREVKTFYESFLSSVKQYGRVFEIGILMRYNMVSRHIFADADLGPKVMSKGLVHFFPNKIKGKEEVARIFRRFAERRKEG